jgi:hypothetical protein
MSLPPPSWDYLLQLAKGPKAAAAAGYLQQRLAARHLLFEYDEAAAAIFVTTPMAELMKKVRQRHGTKNKNKIKIK